MTAPHPPPRPTYWWIQYLRGFAAAGVVIYHACKDPMVPPSFSFEIGAHGVDVFFVISGFIMYSAARDERVVQFVSRRLIRVFPLYWLATALAVMLGLAFDGIHPSGTEAVLSLALLPHYSEAHGEQIWPILVPGWTLSYEMLFYGLFALGIAARRVVTVPALAIVLLVALGAIFQPHLAPLIVATNPLLIEFLLGLLIALAVHRRPALLLPIVCAAVAVAVAGLVLGSDRTTLFAGAAAIVSSAVLLERRPLNKAKLPSRPIPALRLLGDASYSIYLFHVPFLFVVERLFADSLVGASQLTADAAIGSAIVAALGLGVLLHLVLEKPVLRILNGWNRRMLARTAPAAPAAA